MMKDQRQMNDHTTATQEAPATTFEESLQIASGPSRGFDPETGEIFPDAAVTSTVEQPERVIDIGVVRFIKMNMLAPKKNYMSLKCLENGADWEEDIAVLVGIANGHGRRIFTDDKTGEKSPSVELTGDFRADSLITGRTFKARCCYMPLQWSELVEQSLIAAGVPANPKRDALQDLTDDEILALTSKPPGSPEAIMHVTIGYKSTGNPGGIPFQWTIKVRQRSDAILSRADALFHAAMNKGGLLAQSPQQKRLAG